MKTLSLLRAFEKLRTYRLIAFAGLGGGGGEPPPPPAPVPAKLVVVIQPSDVLSDQPFAVWPQVRVFDQYDALYIGPQELSVSAAVSSGSAEIANGGTVPVVASLASFGPLFRVRGLGPAILGFFVPGHPEIPTVSSTVFNITGADAGVSLRRRNSRRRRSR